MHRQDGRQEIDRRTLLPNQRTSPFAGPLHGPDAPITCRYGLDNPLRLAVGGPLTQPLRPSLQKPSSCFDRRCLHWRT